MTSPSELQLDDGVIVDQDGDQNVCYSPRGRNPPRFHLINPESLETGKIKPKCTARRHNGGWHSAKRDQINSHRSICHSCSGKADLSDGGSKSAYSTLTDLSPKEFDKLAEIEGSAATEMWLQKNGGAE